jgi:hypothetical protein
VNGAPGFDGHGTCEFDGDCNGIVGACALTASCYFGPPIPLVASGLPTCIVNAFLTDYAAHVQLLPPTGDAGRGARATSTSPAMLTLVPRAWPACATRRQHGGALHASRLPADVAGLLPQTSSVPRLVARRAARG